MKEEQNELGDIHFKIPVKLKENWKQEFKKRGHNTLKSGISTAVFNYLNLKEIMSSEKLDYLIQLTENIQSLIKSKNNKNSKKEVKPSNHDPQLETIIISKMEMYQPIDILYLSTLTKIEGKYLYYILKEMEKQDLIELTEDYEWILKI